MSDTMTPPSAPGPGDVTFTVKELFLEIRNDFRELSSEMRTLERRGSDQLKAAMEKVEDLERKITSLQIQAASQEAVDQVTESNRKLTWGVLIAIVGMIANVIVGVLKH